VSTGERSVIAITDCGSTTTKAILIERVDGVYRQTFRGEAPTTVEAPVEDVTAGVRAALEDLGALCGRRLVSEAGDVLTPGGSISTSRPPRQGAGSRWSWRGWWSG